MTVDDVVVVYKDGRTCFIQAKKNQPLWPTELLIATPIEILPEADKTDDVTMIQRAIRLRDRLLKMDLRDMETLLDRAARN